MLSKVFRRSGNTFIAPNTPDIYLEGLRDVFCVPNSVKHIQFKVTKRPTKECLELDCSLYTIVVDSDFTTDYVVNYNYVQLLWW